MNYFFGINNHIFKSEIQIPLFKNRTLKTSNLKLYKCYPQNNKWVVEEINNRKNNEYFFILKNKDISNNEIYFLANEKDLVKFDNTKLKKINDFTNSIPAYRANFKIYIQDGGFSSFQSEYPHSMTSKKGTILSSVSSLVNYKTKKIEEKYQIFTNNTNFIKINKNMIKPEIFLITEKYLGIPMYVSVKDKFLSFEHTHPPHEYILSKNKFIKVNNLKNEINEIIN